MTETLLYYLIVINVVTFLVYGIVYLLLINLLCRIFRCAILKNLVFRYCTPYLFAVPLPSKLRITRNENDNSDSHRAQGTDEPHLRTA
jgi:hypothetical protein